MVNLEHKLTVDDLIVEYMMYKVKNGYEPCLKTNEFMNFLHYFERKMKVEDILYDTDELFKRFFERKTEHDWSSINWITKEKILDPHMDIKYSEKDNDYIIRANYKFSNYDKSVINTYFMDYGSYEYKKYEGTPGKIRKIIGEYLLDVPKRVIDETVKTDDNDILIGKYLSAEIITQIWNSYIDKKIEDKTWPRQCNDINKYLIDMDLAKIIGIKSIKNELLELYSVLSKRIAILYHLDRNLEVSSDENVYLSRENYELLIKGYENIIGIAFGPYKKSLKFDLSSFTFTESHEMDGTYCWDDDPDVKVTTSSIENDSVKKLIRKIERANKK